MQEEFREEYRKANDSVHVPEELMERTVKAVRTEERRQKTTYFWKYAAMAACVCIVCFGGWKLTMGDRIRVQDVTFSSGEMQIGLTLGNQEAKPDGEEKKNSLRLRYIRWKKRGTFRKNCGRWNRAGSMEKRFSLDRRKTADFMQHMKQADRFTI